MLKATLHQNRKTSIKSTVSVDMTEEPHLEKDDEVNVQRLGNYAPDAVNIQLPLQKRDARKPVVQYSVVFTNKDL